MSFKTKTAPTKAPGNPPVAKYQDGLISVSVWENATEKGTFYSVTHERRYKDEDVWKSSQSYPGYEIQTLRKLLDMAHTAILEATALAKSQKSE
jgi:hypothetical protein